MREMTVFTHRNPAETGPTLARLVELAAQAGVTLRCDEEETRKHALTRRPGLEVDAPVKDDVELCVVLGGDGTILRALQRYAGTPVPVFAVNFGEIGFLATVEQGQPSELDEGLARALRGDFELLRLPAIVLDGPGRGQRGINDVAIHRKVGERVAEIAYALDGEVVGSVRCDGLVIATPAGSTGYNLANGGPVMAWGVEGCVVVHRAPLAHRACPGRRAEGPADDPEPLAGAARRRRRRAPGGRARSRRHRRRALRGCRRHDRPAAGFVRLPPAAREVRPPGELSGCATAGAARPRPCRLRRRRPSDRPMTVCGVCTCSSCPPRRSEAVNESSWSREKRR